MTGWCQICRQHCDYLTAPRAFNVICDCCREYLAYLGPTVSSMAGANPHVWWATG